MRHYFRLLIIAIMATSLFIIGCSRKPASYFRKVGSNGKYEIVGKYPIPDEMGSKVKCYHFIYNEKGKLVKVEYLNRGRLQNDSFFGAAQVTIEYSEGYEKRVYLDSKGMPMNGSKDGYSIRLKLDKNNYPISLFKYDEKGNITEDQDGVSQYLWTLDEKGQRIKSIRFDKNGNRIANINGIYETKSKYDDRGNIIETRFFGVDEKLKEDEKSGSAIICNKYDEIGNNIEMRYFGVDEKLKEDKDLGVAIIRTKYDDHGNRIEIRYFGIDEKLKESKNSGVAIIRFKYNNEGDMIELANFGIYEQLKEDEKMGIAVIHNKYDDQGNRIEIRYLGTDEKLKEDKNKEVAMICLKYDKNGNEIEERYFGIDQKLKDDEKFGIAMIRLKYDKNSNVIEERYFGSDGKLKGYKESDVAMIQYKYDEQGKMVEEVFFDRNEIVVSVYGTLTDSRDGKTYKTVKIGTQTWMAENLNYSSGNSWCYDNSSSNCTKYGRLYYWKTAKKVCPSGWHLPSDTEWTTMTDYLGGEVVAGEEMKSSNGFAGLPGGYRSYLGTFHYIGYLGRWWSSTEYQTYLALAWNRTLYYGNDKVEVDRYYCDKEDGLSVRCVRDL